jgi:isopentenyldiphosphate isomerase
MSFLDHIARCNNADLSQFEPWFIGSQRAGFIHRDFAPRLPAPLFAHRDDTWHLDPSLDSPDKRTAAMRAFLLKLRADGLFGDTWVPRRSYKKPTFPGELDNTVAGGQPAGIGIRENLIKECHEEAAIPRQLAERARAVSIITYWNQSGPQLKPDIMTCFDLKLPGDFTPQANDGEVQAFELWPVARVFETVRDSKQFKYNCNLVLIDFFVRHGLLSADDPDFATIVSGLRQTRQ